MPQAYEAAVPPYFYLADGPALNTFTGPSLASPAPDCVIPANQLAVGSRLRITAAGRYSTTATPTYNFGLYWGGVGGVALCTTGALPAPSSVTNLSWRLSAIIDIRAIGATGSALAMMEFLWATAATTGAAFLAPASAPAAVAIDTTAAKALVLGVTCGTSSASNAVTCHQWLVESVA